MNLKNNMLNKRSLTYKKEYILYDSIYMKFQKALFGGKISELWLLLWERE